MKKSQKTVLFIGRIFISLLFILIAINNIIKWQETEHNLTNILLDWQSFSSFHIGLQNFFTNIIEWIPAVLIFLTSIQLLGGLLLFFGMKVRLGSILLILYLFLTTLLFNHFWFLSDAKREVELLIFLKNISIMGGLFYVLALGNSEDKKEEVASFSSPPKSPSPDNNKDGFINNSISHFDNPQPKNEPFN